MHPNDHVNASQSTNDTYPAAMGLTILELRHRLSQELGREIGVYPETKNPGYFACGVPEVGPGSLTSGNRELGMIPTCRCGCCI